MTVFLKMRHFLVAIDLQATHKSPLEWLCEGLLSEGDTIHLLTCLPLSSPADTLDLGGEEDMIRSELQSLLHEYEQKLKFKFNWKAIVVSGNPADRILEASEEIKPFMIIMGSRGRSALKRLKYS